ncbi:MAG TPA: hypothetical protein VGL28_02195 [Steroidobacteraceae bacterium]|jgi:hypothetical protein
MNELTPPQATPPDELKARLRALARVIQPPHDLWPRIEGAIRPRRTSRWPLALAAGVVVAGVAIMVAWKTLQAPATAPRLATVRAQPVTAVSFALPQQASYRKARAQLEQLFRQRLTLLQPATRARIETNLKIIDQADDDIRRALEADPASPLLLQQLQSTQQQELDLYTDVVRNTEPALGGSSL